MKNWYKQSKVIDISDQVGRKVFVVCPNCGRWASNEAGDINQELDWKYYYQMDLEEQSVIDRVQNEIVEQQSAMATKVCSICKPPKT